MNSPGFCSLAGLFIGAVVVGGQARTKIEMARTGNDWVAREEAIGPGQAVIRSSEQTYSVKKNTLTKNTVLDVS